MRWRVKLGNIDNVVSLNKKKVNISLEGLKVNHWPKWLVNAPLWLLMYNQIHIMVGLSSQASHPQFLYIFHPSVAWHLEQVEYIHTRFLEYTLTHTSAVQGVIACTRACIYIYFGTQRGNHGCGPELEEIVRQEIKIACTRKKAFKLSLDTSLIIDNTPEGIHK